MEITVSPLIAYEKGKKYEMYVLFVHAKDGAYINVRDARNGRAFRVEVLAPTSVPLSRLKDRNVSLVCTEVTAAGPEFELDAKYFECREEPKKGSKLPLKEGLKVEFKTSLLFSAVNSQLSNDQPFEIAKQIAAFMNTEGGDLYMGVNDQGYVTGVERDLPYLEKLPIVVGESTDAAWSYGPTTDGFKRKLMTAVRCYLGESVQSCLGAFEEIVDEPSGLTYIRIPVKPSEQDVVYIGREDHVFVRLEASVQSLFGRQRDQYLKSRFYMRGERSLSTALESFRSERNQLAKEIAQQAAAISKVLKKSNGDDGVVSVSGRRVKMESDACFPLDEKFLSGLNKPAGFVYKLGEVFTPVKTWGEFYTEMLALCAAKDPEKFDSLPDVEEFKPKRRCRSTKPNFVRKSDNVRFTKNAIGSRWLGRNRDIRANLTGVCKTSFTDPAKLPLRVLAYFGIPVAAIRVYKGS